MRRWHFVPQGGLFVWARLTGCTRGGQPGAHLADSARWRRAIEQGGGVLCLGAPFYAQQPDAASLRLSFATVDEQRIAQGRAAFSAGAGCSIGDCALARAGISPLLTPLLPYLQEHHMAITLCGFCRVQLLQQGQAGAAGKGVPLTGVGDDQAPTPRLALRLWAEFPILRTEQGGLCETRSSWNTSKRPYPRPALLPHDLAAAKVRELIVFIDLHLELVARDLYLKAFLVARSAGPTERARAQTVRENIPAFARLTQSSLSTLRANSSPWPTAPPSRACRWWA